MTRLRLSDFTPDEESNFGTLHPLICTGPTPSTGCVHIVPKPHPRSGIDMILSSLESGLISIGQRKLDGEQVDRFARILQHGERMALLAVRRRL